MNSIENHHSLLVLSKKKILILFSIAFVVKFLTAMLLRYLISCSFFGYHLDEMVIRGDDYKSYHAAMENYIQTGKYYFFNGKEDIYASRLPHYSISYYILRQFFNIAYTNFIVMVLQIAVECIAILVLANLSYQIIKSTISFYLVYILYLISFQTSFYNNMVLPDSFSVSFLIFTFYYFYKYTQNPVTRNLFKVGLVLGLLVVLKPHFSLLFVLVGLFFLITQKDLLTKKGIYQISKKTVIVSVPLLLLITPWAIRNYGVYKKFMPFHYNQVAGYYYSKADLACRDFLHAFGEDFLPWETTSASYFFVAKDLNNLDYSFPAYAFTKDYNYKDLLEIREAYLKLQVNYSDSLDTSIAQEFYKLRQSFIRENTWRYYLLTPTILIRKFAFHNGVTHLPITDKTNCYKPYSNFFYYLQVGLYWVTLVPGFIGLIWLYKKDWHTYFLVALPIFLIIFFPLTFKWIEKRYFIHSYPALLLGIVYFIDVALRKLKSNFN